MNVSVLDYNIGNLLSVRRALSHCGANVQIAQNQEDIQRADRLVVPGVGAFKKCVETIAERGLLPALLAYACSGKPYLGICVGMQMLLEESSEHGQHPGLSLINGKVTRMKVDGQRIPFIGWKEVSINNEVEKYYFVHSYHAQPTDTKYVLSTYNFGDQKIVAAVKRDNIMGVQFHPEKSGEAGIRFLKKFLAL